MTNNKLFRLIGNLDKRAKKELARFSCSPLYNKNKDVIKLADLLCSTRKVYDGGIESKKKIFQHLYPGRNYNDGRIRNLFSLLYGLAKKFVVVSHITGNQFLYNKTLAERFTEMNLSDESEKLVTIAENEKLRLKYERGYFKYLNELNVIRNTNSLINKDTALEIDSVEKTAEYFAYNLITEIPEQLVELHVIQNNYNRDYSNSFINKLSGCIDYGKLEQITKELDAGKLLAIYINLIRVFNEEMNEESFTKAYEIFRSERELFNRTGKYYLYSALQGACLRLQWKDKRKYSEILLNIYDEIFSGRYYAIEDKYPLPTQLFRAAFNLSVSQKNHEFAEKISSEFIELLDPEERKNMEYLTKSVLALEKKQFSESLEFLNRIKLDRIGNKYDIRILQMKLFFELGHIEQAYSLVSSAREFSKNNRYLSAKRRNNLKNFTMCYRKLLDAKFRQKPGTADELSGFIRLNESLESRDWIEEKLAEIQ